MSGVAVIGLMSNIFTINYKNIHTKSRSKVKRMWFSGLAVYHVPLEHTDLLLDTSFQALDIEKVFFRKFFFRSCSK